MFKSSFTTSESYPAHLKTKMNLGENRPVQVWSSLGDPIAIPEEFRNLRVAAQVHLKSLWLTSSMIGLQWETQNIMLVQAEARQECPFVTSSACDGADVSSQESRDASVDLAT